MVRLFTGGIFIQTSHLRTNVLQLSILQPPQHITGVVSTDAKVEGVKRREALPPNLWREQTSTFYTSLLVHVQ